MFNEIKLDKALSLYGIALCLAYVLSIFHWYQSGGLHFPSLNEPWCWPFFPQCWNFRITLNLSIIHFLTIFLLALISLFYFIFKKIDKACFFLFLTWIVTLLLVIQDFRFRSNQFYILSWVTLVFLFAPSKKTTIPVIIIAIYFWAGRLKLNWEWISGSALYEKLWLIPEQLIVASCVYVIVLEMIFIWGLLSKRRLIFWGTISQLLLFHIQSFSQVAYWYPCLMFLILSFFVLNRFFTNQSPQTQNLNIQGWQKSSWIIFILFSIFQLNPIIYVQTPLRVSSWRFMSLNMFEAKYNCNIEIYKNIYSSIKQLESINLHLAPRMRCDPVIYWNHLRNRCRELNKEPGFQSTWIKISYKKATDINYKIISMYCDEKQEIKIEY